MEYSRLWKESSSKDDKAALKESNSISVQTTPSPTHDTTSPSLSCSQPVALSGKFQSFERLARSVIDLQSIVDKEREINRALQEENIKFKLKLGQISIEKMEAEPGKLENHSNPSLSTKKRLKRHKIPLL